MKFLSHLIITLMAMLIPLSSSVAEAKSNQQIKSIFFQKNNDAEVVQIRLSGKVLPKIFELGGDKPRVVLDFVETGYEPNKIRTIKAGGVLVSRIRVGLHSKPIAKTRVVIDMVEGMKYSFAKEYIAEGTIFRISFNIPNSQKSEKKQALNGSAQQSKNTAPSLPAAGEMKKQESSVEKVEIQKDVEIKNTQKSEASLKPPANTSQKPEASEKKEEGSRKESIERNKDNYSDVAASKEANVEAGKAHTLLNVRYERNINDNEMVLFQLNGFYPPIVYSAESGGLLVVCDFLDAELGPDRISVNTRGGRYIRHVKVDPYQHPKKVRVVLELADRYAYDVKQVFFKEENLFVIVLNSLGEKTKKK